MQKSDPMQMSIERLYRNLDVLADWQTRYAFIIELGKKIPPFPEEQKIKENRVKGCMSKVYMTAEAPKGPDDPIHFQACSDALIVNGLVAMLKIIYDGKTPNEMMDIDMEKIFSDLGFAKHLSPIRRNGFFSMVRRLKQLAHIADDKS